MKKSIVQNVIIHEPEDINFRALTDKMNELYVEVIERRLNCSGLTVEEKISVIDRIMENLKFCEQVCEQDGMDGIIR